LKLTSLTKLNLGGNQLTSVPESIGQLTSLTKEEEECDIAQST